ncbi:MAG: flagellar export protein FliJ, partial [Limisphaerales bacterium]
MKPFRFSLQPLRSIREHKEQAARAAYANCLRACEEAAARMQAASAELTASWTKLSGELAAGTTGIALLRARAWCNVLELRVKERAASLEEARHAIDSAWHDLLLATREREAIDRLHDKRLEAHNRLAAREEQKTLDELALQLFHAPAPDAHLAGPRPW